MVIKYLRVGGVGATPSPPGLVVGAAVGTGGAVGVGVTVVPGGTVGVRVGVGVGAVGVEVGVNPLGA